MGCAFCASTIGGRIRDLTAGEILGQVAAVGRDRGERIDGVVMMGIGEPLDNYENAVRFLRLVSAPEGLNIGLRHISVSTCGIVPRIRDLANEGLPVTLSISLHAPTDGERGAIMPVNRRWGIAELMSACRDYFDRTGRRISFEYTLIAGKNDEKEDAMRLAGLLRREIGPVVHVNLIPVNEVRETGLFAPSRAKCVEFCETLKRNGVNATIRRTLGSDINASCGQLRRIRDRIG
jgi:23S rRNA (adenine2503-C2)-methyltransferase